MTPQAGFTLVETLVASVISTVVAGAVLSALYMTNTQIHEGSSNLRLCQMQAVVSEQIRKSAREAYCVKKTGDLPAGLPPLNDPAITGLTAIVFCGSAGDTLSGYRIQPDGILEEYKRGDGLAAGFYPFEIGGETVLVGPKRSLFDILPGRRGVAFRLFYRIRTDTLYKFPGIREVILCRNR